MLNKIFDTRSATIELTGVELHWWSCSDVCRMAGCCIRQISAAHGLQYWEVFKGCPMSSSLIMSSILKRKR